MASPRSGRMSEQMMYLLTCSICLEAFDNEDHIPRLLPCQHTFCSSCLKLLIKDNTICCPICREDHPVPVGGIHLFPKNMTLMTLLDFTLNSSAECAKCCGPGSRRCTECQDWFCVKCGVPHFKVHALLNNVYTIRGVLKGIPTCSEMEEYAESVRTDVRADAADLIKNIKQCEETILHKIDQVMERTKSTVTEVQEDCDLIEQRLSGNVAEFLPGELMELDSRCRDAMLQILPLKGRSMPFRYRVSRRGLLEVTERLRNFGSILSAATGSMDILDASCETLLDHSLDESDGSSTPGSTPSTEAARADVTDVSPLPLRGQPDYTRIGTQRHIVDNVGSPRGITTTSVWGSEQRVGLIALADFSGHRIFFLDSNGKHLGHIGDRRGRGWGELDKPSGLAMEGEHFVVANRGTNRIQCIANNGRTVRGDFSCHGKPLGMAMDPRGMGRIFVCLFDGKRVVVFNRTGDFLYQLSLNPPRQFKYPYYVACHHARQNNHTSCTVAVTDSLAHTVEFFDADSGRYLKTFGGADDLGVSFVNPRGVAFDNDGNLLVADHPGGETGRRVQAIDPSGRVIWAMPVEGIGWLHDITVTTEGHIAVAGHDLLYIYHC